MTTSPQNLIPILDLEPEITALRPQLLEVFDRVLRSRRFILGPEVEAFEQEAARYLGVRHAVSCNSGTDALVMALRALEIGPGDEVITPSFTFFATVEAICNVGARPVFADIDPVSFNLDPAAVEATITRSTKAILPVHLFGNAAPMDAIVELARRHQLRVVEDTAQAFGGKYRGRMLGTIGDVGAFSFFPSKNLGAFGDGGLVATNDDQIAQRVRKLRTHGGLRKYQNEMIGYNSRLDELQAAILRVKLPHVDAWNQARREAAAKYDQLLKPLDWVRTPVASEEACHVYHQYTVRITGPDRDAVQQQLRTGGIQTMVYYPRPVHQLPVFASMAHPPLPHSEQASRQVLSLPMGPFLKDATIQRIVETLREAAKSNEI